MNGDAAEEVVRMALNGADISIRLVGAGAKNLAALLVAWAKKEKTKDLSCCSQHSSRLSRSFSPSTTLRRRSPSSL